MLLLVLSAHAHPGSGAGAPAALRDYIGHRLALEVGADRVAMTYVAELPERRVLAEARESAEPGYATRLLESLADEVKLTWNGTPLPATRRDVAAPVAPGDGGFLAFTVGWDAALPATAGRLGVRNGNLPSDPGFFATAITLDGRWMADATSLLAVRGGTVRDNWHGAWVKDERAREPWVDLRPAGLFERSASPAPLPTRMTGVASGGVPAWVHALAAVALVGLALIGRALGRRANRPRSAA